MNAIQILARVLHVDESKLSADTALDTVPAWDSFAMVSLVMYLEDHLGREIEQSEMENIKSVSDVQKLLG